MQLPLYLYDFSKCFKSFRKVEVNTEVLELQKRNEFLERSNRALRGWVNNKKQFKKT